MKSDQLAKIIAFLMLATSLNTQTLIDDLIDEILTITETPWNPLTKTYLLEDSYNPDADLSTPEIAIRHGYPAEAHTVKTQDGYLLTMHRIPCGQSGCQEGGRGSGQPVFLQHSLLLSSADWVISGPGKGLAYILADAGYDVWLGNARGNTYSRRHVSMSNEDSKFWDFSWHEMGIYDISAEIDYIYDIKDERNSPNNLLYIGHSMGTTMAFVLLACRPEYNNKIRAVFTLSPIAYMGHVRSPITLLAPFSKDFEMISKLLGPNEFLPHSIITKYLAKFGCELTEVEQYICDNILVVVAGFDKTQMNSTLMPVIFGHIPSGTSTKTVVHYLQEIDENGNFQQFDYGRTENMMRYGYEKPPSYNMSNIITPIALFYAEEDSIAGPSDVERLYKDLQRTSIGMFKVPTDRFNHVDFLWGIDAPELVYVKLMDLMGTFR